MTRHHRTLTTRHHRRTEHPLTEPEPRAPEAHLTTPPAHPAFTVVVETRWHHPAFTTRHHRTLTVEPPAGTTRPTGPPGSIGLAGPVTAIRPVTPIGPITLVRHVGVVQSRRWRITNLPRPHLGDRVGIRTVAFTTSDKDREDGHRGHQHHRRQPLRCRFAHKLTFPEPVPEDRNLSPTEPELRWYTLGDGG